MLENKKRDEDVDAAEGPVYDQVPLEERLSQMAGESPLALFFVVHLVRARFLTVDEEIPSRTLRLYIRKFQALMCCGTYSV